MSIPVVECQGSGASVFCLGSVIMWSLTRFVRYISQPLSFLQPKKDDKSTYYSPLHVHCCFSFESPFLDHCYMPPSHEPLREVWHWSLEYTSASYSKPETFGQLGSPLLRNLQPKIPNPKWAPTLYPQTLNPNPKS